MKPARGCFLFFVGIIVLFLSVETFRLCSKKLPKEQYSGFFGGIVKVSLIAGGVYYFFSYRNKKKDNKDIKNNTIHEDIKPKAERTSDTVTLHTDKGDLDIYNPYRGFFVVAGAGAGKSESVAVPLLSQFVEKQFCGIIYDFKFPALAKEVHNLVDENTTDLRHFYLNFDSPYTSHRVNPLKPSYLRTVSYAREYASCLILNLIKESIKKGDFWTRSATDLLTAVIWYLKVEKPEICDLPHVCAMVTSEDTKLIEKLSKNPQTAQMITSIASAMKRGSDNQIAGVVGTLQGAIAQINTPEIMYIFGGDDFSLDLNNARNKTVLTVGNNPLLSSTFAPLCSLVITVASKLMNQEGKAKSFVLLDEAPTVFIPNIEQIPNTGRSNKIATVIMCQDLAQLKDCYGDTKANVLFSSCNNHFYGRVASSHTSEILSKQFGKYDKVFKTTSTTQKATSILSTEGKSENIQERAVIPASDFLSLKVGEFACTLTESSADTTRAKFKMLDRGKEKPFVPTEKATESEINAYYLQVRKDINEILGI